MKTSAWRVVCAICFSLLGFASLHITAQRAPPRLELLTLRSKIFSNTRTIRVWLPPGYHAPRHRGHRYAVFYFTDGGAVFDARQLDKIADELVAKEKIPPTLFVGIDNGGSTRESKNPGSDRADEYCHTQTTALRQRLKTRAANSFRPFLKKKCARSSKLVTAQAARLDWRVRPMAERSLSYGDGKPRSLQMASDRKSVALHCRQYPAPPCR